MRYKSILFHLYGVIRVGGYSEQAHVAIVHFRFPDNALRLVYEAVFLAGELFLCYAY